MTATHQPTGTPAPAPGGTARLAGRVVARVGFGVMQLGYPTVSRDTALAILRQATAAGVNHLDTAHFYGPSNAYIRAALAPYPDGLALVTKVGAVRDPGGTIVLAQRPEQLRAQVEANLAGLGVEQVTVVNLRRADHSPGLRAEGDQKVDIDSQLAELSALRDAGKIGGIGLSGVSAGQIRHAAGAGIECVQNSYGLLNRSDEPALDACREHGIAWVPFFPLGSSGYLKLPKPADNPAVKEIAADFDATPAQVALAWLLAHDDHTLLIPGTSSATHLAENIAAGSIRLSRAAMLTLDLLG